VNSTMNVLEVSQWVALVLLALSLIIHVVLDDHGQGKG